jgi:hypothetical protein
LLGVAKLQIPHTVREDANGFGTTIEEVCPQPCLCYLMFFRIQSSMNLMT